jgi:hypothetical protein
MLEIGSILKSERLAGVLTGWVFLLILVDFLNVLSDYFKLKAWNFKAQAIGTLFALYICKSYQSRLVRSNNHE